MIYLRSVLNIFLRKNNYNKPIEILKIINTMKNLQNYYKIIVKFIQKIVNKNKEEKKWATRRNKIGNATAKTE